MAKVVLNSADIAEKFGISRTTLWKWRRRGYLPKPTYLMGSRPYWDAADLEAYLRDQRAIR